MRTIKVNHDDPRWVEEKPGQRALFYNEGWGQPFPGIAYMWTTTGQNSPGRVEDGYRTHSTNDLEMLFIPNQELPDGGKYLIISGKALDSVTLINEADDTTEKDAPDTVNHPQHYVSHPSGVECIQVTHNLPGVLSNVVKYLWRADVKGGDEDYRKALRYLRWVTGDTLRIVKCIDPTDKSRRDVEKVLRYLHENPDPSGGSLRYVLRAVQEIQNGEYRNGWILLDRCEQAIMARLGEQS